MLKLKRILGKHPLLFDGVCHYWLEVHDDGTHLGDVAAKLVKTPKAKGHFAYTNSKTGPDVTYKTRREAADALNGR